jgi:ferrous iron transport protein A
MYQGKQLSLVQMRRGQAGTVVGVMGGMGLIRRLDALGIRPGRRVTKISSALFRGPVTLRVDSAQVALGFGMAKKIVVEVDKYLPDNPVRR